MKSSLCYVVILCKNSWGTYGQLLSRYLKIDLSSIGCFVGLWRSSNGPFPCDCTCMVGFSLWLMKDIASKKRQPLEGEAPSLSQPERV